MNVERLTWDSDFFGLRIGRADIRSSEDSCALVHQKESLKAGFDLVYVFGNQGIGFLVKVRLW